MWNHRSFIPALLLASVALIGCGREEGAGDTPAAVAEPAGGAITQWSDSTELFMEHPALIVGQPEKFAVHLTDLTDFEPLRSGRITLRFVPKSGGEPVVVVQDAPRSPGIYGPSPEFARPGVYDLTIQVESPQARDVIRVPDLRVYATADGAPHEEEAGDAGIPFLKEQQWKTPGFRTAFASTGSVTESLPATGEIIPAAGRYAVVAAPIGGLVDATGVARSPSPGEAVRAGQTVAILTPSLGEGGGSYAQARRELREAEDEYARARRLYAVEAVPQRRVHEAEIRLQAAREELAGLAGAGANGRLAVRTPISGVVSERHITPGSRVDAGQPLFTVVDPSVVWLKVNVPAAQAPQAGGTSGASFSIPGSDRSYTARRVVSVGSVIDPQSRTVPVIYEVANPGGQIRVGSTATVAVRTGRPASGVLVPSSAILEEDGRPLVYVQPEGERFERRDVVVGGEENGMTLLTSGVQAGDRVVTGAAYQVRLASLSTAVPTHGHVH